MIIDILIVVIILSIGLIGYRRGLWAGVLHFATTLLSLWFADRYAHEFSQRILSLIPLPDITATNTPFAYNFDVIQQRFENLVVFLIVVVVAKVITNLIIMLFYNGTANPSFISKILGTVLGLITSLIVAMFVTYFIALYPNDFLQQQLSNSRLAGYILFEIPYISTFVQQI
ncbi:CvpA family protein [Staphylococcus auricularis]|uniref:CvpA family protein n=1 Tax=Staphylococcus auricularis TaxID=29379 RepID=UPI00248D4C03|nr:CvpA family protein [Staphylococcus auricularis]